MVNLRRRADHFLASEYPLLIEVREGARRRIGFLLCGSVRMPDHGHALIRTGHPLTISQAIHDVKKVSVRRLPERRGTQGPLGPHQFWDRFVRHAKEFRDRLQDTHLNPVRKGRVNRPEDGRRSSDNHFSLDPATVRGCSIQIDDVRLPEEYRG